MTAPHAASARTVNAWRTSTILSLVVGYAGYYLCRSNFAVTTKLLEDDPTTGLSTDNIGMIITAGTVMYAIGKLLSGVACDFLGGRVPFLTAMLGTILCTWGFGLGGGFAAFAVAWCLNRFVQSTGWSALVKVSSNWFSYDHYGRVMSILSLSWLFGDFFGRMLLGHLMQQGMGWRGIFFTAGAVLLAIWLISLFTIKETPEDVGGEPAQINPDNIFGEEGTVPRAHDLRELLWPFLSSVSFWAVLAMCFGLTLIRETFNNWLARWLVDVAHLDSGTAAKFSAWYPFFGGCSVILCGWITDRYLRGRRGLIIAVPLIMLVPVLVVMGRLTAVSPTTAIVLEALSALFMIGPYSFLGGAISLDLGGRHGSATAAGLIDCAGYAGGAVSGWGIAQLLTVGVVHDQGRNWPLVFSTLAGAAVFATLAALYYWYRHEIVEHREHVEHTVQTKATGAIPLSDQRDSTE